MNKSEFKHRRSKLMRLMGNNSIAIIPTSPTTIRNRDVEYAYRPDSDFYYLTGFKEPEALAVLVPKRKQGCLSTRVEGNGLAHAEVHFAENPCHV